MLQPQPTESAQPTRRFEISAILLLALGALALVSLYSSAAGIVGTWIASALRYAFGSLSIVPPLMIITHALLSLRHGRQVHYSRRALAVVSLYFVALCTVHLFSNNPGTFNDVWSGGVHSTSGGALGGLIAFVLLRAVGAGGSWVLLAAWLVTSLIFLTETSVSRFVAGIFGILGSIFRGLRLGWNDFWRGVRLELSELIRLVARRKRKQSEETARVQNKKKKRPVRKRRQKKAQKFQDEVEPEVSVMNIADPVREVETDSFTEQPNGEAYEATVFKESSVLRVDTEHDETEMTQEQEATRRRKKRRTVHSGDEVLDVANGFNTNATGYELPPTSLLDKPARLKTKTDKTDANQAQQLAESLELFGIDAKVVNVSRGPTVTRYEVQPAPGVKVKQITSLADDLALALAATGIRIEAPVPGKAVVGIEVPNKETVAVALRDVIETDAFQDGDGKLLMALGKDIAGKPAVADLRRLLHVLIAGATGSGKSVCINSIIISILYKAHPDEVKLLMIDPKRVELAVYDGIPHLVTPVVTDPKQAAGALRWAVKEMEHRYTQFSQVGVRNIDGYNRYVANELERLEKERVAQQQAMEEEQIAAETAPLDAEVEYEGESSVSDRSKTLTPSDQNQNEQESKESDPEPLPYIVIIIDELADLMMVAQHDVEDSISRLAQMARAAGIHLIIATQRPSVDVITGLIKANVPSRISFAVSSSHDSRTILDMVGAERLVGKGDMLYYPSGQNQPIRAQGAFVSDKEVQAVVDFWKAQGEPEYDEEVAEEAPAGAAMEEESDDELYEDAVRLVMDTNTASISMLQRRFRIGYARAARLIDTMELQGIVGPYQGSKPREVLRRTIDEEE